jgi:signal transduction histidine kinase/CheY-like chemotaxis protein/HPt (histidine-containing phosphotransfer) domain-containing protein
MKPRSIYDAFLAQQGAALVEFRGRGVFKPLAALPDWFRALWHTGRSKSFRLAEKSPFLENFLADAEEFWKSKAPRSANSGNWIERDAFGKEIPLEASAFWLAGKRVLLVRNLSGTFAQQQQLLQTARESLLAHERLIRETQKKEILLHCIIHDLSQPLTAMRGCFDLLLAKNLPPDVAKFVQTGHQESQRQEQMIRSILEAFSADLSGQQSPTQVPAEPPDLAACARQAVEQFSPAFTERGVRLVFDPSIDPHRNWRSVGDAPRIDRIFGNLLENALRYSPKGSRVTVGVEDCGAALTAFVDDEGPGLPADVSRDRIFALFGKGKDRPGKAGLGLYFCKMTVERWGGAIGADNRPDGGSRFWFRLPRAPEKSAPQQEAPAPVSAGASSELIGPPEKALRILVADDNETIRELAVELLRARGHSVTGVADGRAALGAMDRAKPDVILLDQEMPHMNGVETARAIREKEKSGGKRATIIALSGGALAEDKRRALDAGMDAFLAKPFDRGALFQIVETPARTSLAASSGEIAPLAETETDLRAHLQRVTGGSEKLLRSLISSFLADAPGKLSAIERAVAGEDADALASSAHSLKGAIAIFNAQRSVSAARNLEGLGRARRLQGAGEEVRALKEDLARLERELRALLPQISGRRSRRSARTNRRPHPKR